MVGAALSWHVGRPKAQAPGLNLGAAACWYICIADTCVDFPLIFLETLKCLSLSQSGTRSIAWNHKCFWDRKAIFCPVLCISRSCLVSELSTHALCSKCLHSSLLVYEHLLLLHLWRWGDQYKTLFQTGPDPILVDHKTDLFQIFVLVVTAVVRMYSFHVCSRDLMSRMRMLSTATLLSLLFLKD